MKFSYILKNGPNILKNMKKISKRMYFIKDEVAKELNNLTRK